jgi:hypothetical protein
MYTKEIPKTSKYTKLTKQQRNFLSEKLTGPRLLKKPRPPAPHHPNGKFSLLYPQWTYIIISQKKFSSHLHTPFILFKNSSILTSTLLFPRRHLPSGFPPPKKKCSYGAKTCRLRKSDQKNLGAGWRSAGRIV